MNPDNLGFVQALFICLLLPFLSKLWGIPFYQLPNYLKDGAACFLNYGTISSGEPMSHIICISTYFAIEYTFDNTPTWYNLRNKEVIFVIIKLSFLLSPLVLLLFTSRQYVLWNCLVSQDSA